MKSQQKLSIAFVKKSFIALSVAGILTPVFAVGDITNINEPKKQETIGTPAGADTLTGNITTSGSNSNTFVDFRGNSQMQGEHISAESKNNGGANVGATNTITLQENSVLNLTGTAIAPPPNPPAPFWQGVTSYSIFASGLNARNTISDLTTGTARGSITGAIIAFDGGENIINNLRNTQVDGAIIADGAQSKNTISFDAGTTFTSFIAALNSGTNTITLNEGAKLDMKTFEPTENASILAESADSTNTIKGTTKETNKINGAIVAKGGGANTIDLHDLQVTGDIKAIGDNSTNTITLEKGFLTNIITRDSSTATNTINLNGEASIKGHISNLVTGNPAAQKNGVNVILLNQQSTLDLHKGTNVDGAAIYSSNGENKISGNSTGEHKIEGNITAKNSGKNTITLDKLTMTGDITSDTTGANSIKLGSFGSDKNSEITGSVKAEAGGKNDLFFTRVELKGNITATGANSENEARLLDSLVTGNIIAEQQGKNTLILGNGGTDAKVEGAIKAQINSTNKIDFNNGEVVGGIFAEGGRNEITLGHNTFTGKIKSNIEAKNAGTNTIAIESVDMIGSIIAGGAGSSNTITDNRPFDRQSTIEGSIAATNGGTNTITLKNVSISEGITAGGAQAKNTITLGDTQESVVNSSITAEAEGSNEITLADTTNLIGTITAKKNGENVITENGTTAKVDIVGGIVADGGENGITLTHATITEGITAKEAGTNMLIIQSNDRKRVVASDLIAESGGTNTAFVGAGVGNSGGTLQGSLRASGEGSRNEITMQGDSVLSGGVVVADATGNTGLRATTNTITISQNSFINLNDRDAEGAALYANGKNAKNTLTGTSTSSSEITGNVVADSGENGAGTPAASRAKNTIELDDLRITGDVNAFRGGENALKLTQGDIIGNILAQEVGQNNLSIESGSQVTILGTFYAREGGRNEITLRDNSNISITSNNNDKVFQAVGQGATNTIQEINANATTGTITGNIYAEEKGQNNFTARKLLITGNIVSYDGTNTISLGDTQDSGIVGNLLADSANAGGLADSRNTIALNNAAKLEGYLQAQGTNTEKKATNTITLNNDSYLNLVGGNITDEGGGQLGTGNDAIFSETLQAYNKIIDNSTPTTQSTITGNIFAKDNTKDPTQQGGNDITLKHVAITGDIVAQTSGKNVLTLGMTGKNSSIAGNILANDTGTNTLTLTDVTLNTRDRSIQATADNNAGETTNTLILNGSSTITDMYLIANQVQENGNTIGETSNTITLNDASTIKLIASPEGNAILTHGVKSKTTITDNGTGTHSITGKIIGSFDGKNNITLKKVTMSGNIEAISSGVNTIIFGENATSGTFDGDIIALTKFSSSENIITFNGMTIGGTALGKISADSESDNGGKNSIKLDKGSSLSNYWVDAHGENSTNTITLADTASTLALMRDVESGYAIHARGKQAKNTITHTGNTASHTIDGIIQANDGGANDITLYQLTMTGDIIAEEQGTNKLTIGNTTGQSTITGNIEANDGTNTLDITKTQINGRVTATANTAASNTITLKDASVLASGGIVAEIVQGGGDGGAGGGNGGGGNGGGGGGGAGAAATNSIALEGTSALTLNAQDNAILAQGEGAGNTITDTTTNATTSTINGNIKAQNSGTNTITIKKVTMTGDILADEGGKNTIHFGDNAQAGGAQTSATLTGHLIATKGDNVAKLTNATMTGSMRALVDNSTNTLTLESSTLNDGYMAAISETDAASNTLAINAGSTMHLKGVQILDSNGQKVGSGNDAILTKGEHALNSITDNSQNKHTIAGNITADAGGKNTYSFNKVEITGSIRATTKEATNSITIADTSFITKGTILAEGHNVANNLIFTATSTLTDSHLRAVAKKPADGTTRPVPPAPPAPPPAGPNPPANPPAGPTPSPATNTLEFQGNSTFALKGAPLDGIAVLAEGDGAENTIKGNAGTIDGKVVARMGGKNHLTEVSTLSITASIIKAHENQAKNEIAIKTGAGANPPKGTLTLKADANGIAILADDGINDITITSGDHTITGDIVARTTGSNTLEYTTGAAANEKVTIEGDILADGLDSKNKLTLGGASTLTAKIVKATDSSQNKLEFTGTPAGGNGGTFTITANGDNPAVLASDFDSKNEFINTGTSANTITGNIIANRGGKNDITKVAHLVITDGYIVANGSDSANSIVLQDQSKMTLKAAANKAALFANEIDAQNKITDNGASNQQSDITGDILANRGGKNDIAMQNLIINGDIIANDGGENKIDLGPTAAQNLKAEFGGMVLATGLDSKNVFAANAGAEVALRKSGKGNSVVLADGQGASNTIEDNQSGKALTIAGDVSANDGGKNAITYDKVSFSGDIYAHKGGQNTFTFAGETKTTESQAITAIGTGSLNVMNYENFSFDNATSPKLHFDFIAKDSGENRFYLAYAAQNPAPPAQGDPLKLRVETDRLGINTIVAQQVKQVLSDIHYNGGNTLMVLAQSKSAITPGQNITAAAFSDGIMLTLNAPKANEIFKDFRDISALSSNYARVFMEDKDKFVFGGSYVGNVDFLKSAGAPNPINTLKLDAGASLIATLFLNGNGKLKLEMDSGSKWVVIPDKASVELESLKVDGVTLTESQMPKDTLRQTENTLIDLATGGYATKYGVDKPDFTNLVAKQVDSKMDDVIFRVFADTQKKKADVIKIDNVGANSDTKTARLQAYHSAESLLHAKDHVYYPNGTLTSNTLVASVGKDAKDKFAFDISKPTTVEQGYLLVTTEFEKKREKVPSTGGGGGGGVPAQDEIDNYYIKAYGAQINPEHAKNAYGMLGVNYLVFLANTNTLNKRLGEMRDEGYNHGIWARTYAGQITQDFGLFITNDYLSAQTGYDFALTAEKGMHFLGFAFGYGANRLSSSAWTMGSQLLSGALYYSYVGDAGFYSDSVFKYDMIDTKPQLQDLNTTIKSQVFSFTQELGYRVYFDAKQRFFFEAQTEGVLGYMLGMDILQKYSNRPDAQLAGKMSDAIIFRGRAGGVLGYRLKTAKNQTDFRIGTSYLADYNTAKFDLDVSGIASDSLSMGFNQMILANFGINSYLTRHLRLYFEVEAGFIGKVINQNFLANLGLRYSFGTEKREINFGAQADDEESIDSDFKTLNIEAPKVKCNGCNPESGFYIQVTSTPQPSPALANYLARLGYRAHQESGKVTYYLGPYKDMEEAKSKQDFGSKVVQSITRNPNAVAEIFKINNKSKS